MLLQGCPSGSPPGSRSPIGLLHNCKSPETGFRRAQEAAGAAGQCWAHLQPKRRVQPREAQHAGVVLLLLCGIQAAQDLVPQPGLGILQHLQTERISTEIGTHKKLRGIVQGSASLQASCRQLDGSSHERLTSSEYKH